MIGGWWHFQSPYQRGRLRAVPVPFRTIARGEGSKIETRHELVVRTGGTWLLILYKHHGAFEPPEIDFRREMIVAIFAGNRSTHSSSVEIVNVNRPSCSFFTCF